MTTKFEDARRFHETGDLQSASRLYSELLTQTPGNTEVLYWLSVLEFQRGRYPESGRLLEHAIHLNPGNPLLHYALGAVYWALAQFDRAIESYRESIRIKPDFADAHNSLGSTLADSGKHHEAVACYRLALKYNPDFIDPLLNIGVSYYDLGDGEAAVDAFKQVLARAPEHVPALLYLGNSYYEQGETDAATECYRKVSTLTGADGIKIRLATVLPMIMQSTHATAEVRKRYAEQISSLLRQKLHVEDPIKEISYTNFLLAYHGADDRELQQRVATLYLHACPALHYVADHCKKQRVPENRGRTRIGIISRYLKDHSIGKTSGGIVEHLSRDKFEVVVIFLAPPDDATSRRIAQAADKVVILPPIFTQAQKCLADEQLDILFYQDTGMDAFTFFLAFSRLAPVQCTSFGHPVTTGIPNMDYYISTEYWEPPDGREHYSEQLVMLRDVASVAYYYKPQLPAVLNPRAHFGLKDHEHIYLCPQTLFKVHPDFDEVIRNILRLDLLARVVFIHGKHRQWSELLLQRFRTSMPDVVSRISFLPQQRGSDFINLIAVSDVMLDTIHFCGFNTSLEGLSVGVPIVTLPGEFMRSRHTMSFYRKMDYMECVANDVQDYINTALKLGTDRAYRDEVSRHILSKQDCLWEEIHVIREFERVFEEMTGHI